MLKLLPFVLFFGILNALYVTKMTSELSVFDCDLRPNEHLHLQGVKKINKGNIRHIIIKNCTGVIDEKTFTGFPKLNKLTIWRSNIKEISTTLPVKDLLTVGSRIPDLDKNLQPKLPNIESLVLVANKDFVIDPMVLKKFDRLKSLHISEASFTDTCITKEWFRGVTSLESLSLSDNNLDCITEDAFFSTKTLRDLDLTYNKIPNLDKKVFKKLTKLSALGLYENSMDYLDIHSLGNQKNHLRILGISWIVLKNSNISPEDLVKVLPNLEIVTFGRGEMPHDFKAGEFCQTLKQLGVSCELDNVFAMYKVLGDTVARA